MSFRDCKIVLPFHEIVIAAIVSAELFQGV
jgi:hypothetical protein